MSLTDEQDPVSIGKEKVQEGETSGVVPVHRHCYLPAASLLAVMQDQIGYLLSHMGSRCRPGCPDCVRFEEARRCLLKPFA